MPCWSHDFSMQTVFKWKSRPVFIHWRNKYLIFCLNKLLHPHSRREVGTLECTCPSIRSWLRPFDWCRQLSTCVLPFDGTGSCLVFSMVYWYMYAMIMHMSLRFIKCTSSMGVMFFFPQFLKFFYISSVFVHTIFLCKTTIVFLFWWIYDDWYDMSMCISLWFPKWTEILLKVTLNTINPK